MTTNIWETPENAVGGRIDKFLSETLDMTRSAVQTLLDDGNVQIDGKVVGKNYRLRAGDMVQVTIPDPIAYEAKCLLGYPMSRKLTQEEIDDIKELYKDINYLQKKDINEKRIVLSKLPKDKTTWY